MTYQQLWHRLTPLYEEREAQAIVRLLLDKQFGMTLTDVLCDKVSELSADDKQSLEKMMSRLEKGEPVQYVVGEAVFMGRQFHVEPGVLIPRPETESLCQWVKDDYNRDYCALQPPVPLDVLDVGTGSGCIAVTLALDLYNSRIAACDVSGDALLIARSNAHRWDAKVNFRWEDILAPTSTDDRYDIIVSNPPYICERERADMSANVLEHEPETALFVPDDDPLRFYRAIADYGLAALKPGGALYFETNPLYINKVCEMLSAVGYQSVAQRPDPFGKQRFTKAIRP